MPAIYTSAVITPISRIDWRAFLARPPLPRPKPEVLDAFADTPLLITGAGGSIGSALALHLAQSGSRRTVLLDASEDHLHHLQQALARAGTSAEATFVLGDAGEGTTLEEIFFAHQPRVVFHAAAHKHVPLLELQPFAAITNNILGTEAVVAGAAKHGARVLLLSTDKAVHPASVMGATKRIAEEIVLASGGTALRLGNVLGSSGGVTEIFQEQAARGGPLTVTDLAARRYFLTMEEAVNLLLAAAYIAADTGSDSVLAPALAADHGIADLAGFIARTLAPDRELPIHFTGLRPGDKLAERLWDDGERASPVKDGLLSIHAARPEPRDLANGLAILRAAVRVRDLAAALAELRTLVPGYHPSETVLGTTKNSAQRVYA
ncbi:MAG: polysaccharide biosynthesis protein [Terracidiphilus sp.]